MNSYLTNPHFIVLTYVLVILCILAQQNIHFGLENFCNILFMMLFSTSSINYYVDSSMYILLMSYTGI